jgi:DNA-binding beta-propeller fold protein YncE
VQQSASQVLVANHSVTGAQQDSITKLNFSSTVIGSTNTISLPANSAPNFVATTEGSQAYVLLPNLTSVGVVNTVGNSLSGTFPVGNNPVAMAETPNTQKLYVANQDDSTIERLQHQLPEPVSARGHRPFVHHFAAHLAGRAFRQPGACMRWTANGVAEHWHRYHLHRRPR